MHPQYTSDAPLKQCSKCKELKPATTEYFYRHKGGKHGLNPRCKQCCNSGSRQRYKEGGRERGKINARKLRAENLEAHKERDRQYYLKNKERIKERSKNYRIANLEVVRQKNREYTEKNHEKLREKGRKYYKLNRDKWKVFANKRRTRKQKLPTSFSIEEWQSCVSYFNGVCAACGNPPTFFNGLEADHFIPLTSADCPGMVKSNVIPLCKTCNSSKNDNDALEWATWKFGKRKAKLFVEKVQKYFDSLNG